MIVQTVNIGEWYNQQFQIKHPKLVLSIRYLTKCEIWPQPPLISYHELVNSSLNCICLQRFSVIHVMVVLVKGKVSQDLTHSPKTENKILEWALTFLVSLCRKLIVQYIYLQWFYQTLTIKIGFWEIHQSDAEQVGEFVQKHVVENPGPFSK